MNRFHNWWALGLLFAAACASAPEPAPEIPDIAAYAPLGVGYAWTYAVRFPGQTGERTVRIVERDAEGYFVDDAGGALRHTSTGLRDRKRYLVKAPLEVGQSWKSVVSASAVERFEILSVGEPCDTKAGRFSDCVRVASSLRRSDEVTLVAEFTWARDIGLVKIETIAEVAGKGRIPQTEQSLLRYELDGVSGGAETGAVATEEEDAPPEWSR